LTLEILYPNKSILVSNICHLPNSPVNVSLMDHSNNFLELLDSHLNRLSSGSVGLGEEEKYPSQPSCQPSRQSEKFTYVIVLYWDFPLLVG